MVKILAPEMFFPRALYTVCGVRCEKLIWECIRPETFVYEAGPEPAVVVKPVTLHKDMQSLVDDSRFSDIRFSFKVSTVGCMVF